MTVKDRIDSEIFSPNFSANCRFTSIHLSDF
jgi:hypothetical protein